MTNAVEEFLAGGGAPSAKFPTKGTMVKGTITDLKVTQQTDPKDGKPKTWDDGNPRMQLVVTLATDDRDADVDEDDGSRRLFIASKGMKDAVREALKQAGAKSLDVGGTLAVRYEADGEKTNPAFNPPKLFVAQYKAPENVPASVGADELL